MFRLFRLWRLGRRDLQLLWFALRHPDRPGWVFPAAAFLILYALDPLNFAMPFIGLVDEVVVVPLLLHGMVKFLPPVIRSGFERRSFNG
jgi:uncharacterized membrane protein YkvA (DUF1232 family)